VRVKFFPIIALLLFANTLLLEASSNLFVSTIPFKEGMIYYKFSGNTKGFAKAYFKNYGSKVALYEESYSPIMNKRVRKSLTITKNGYTTTINLLDKKGSKSLSLRSKLLEIFENLDNNEQERVLNSPSSKILNISCQNISLKGLKICMNGSLILKKDIEIFGYNQHMVAVLLKEEKVDENHFKISEDIKILDDDFQNNSAEEIIESIIE